MILRAGVVLLVLVAAGWAARNWRRGLEAALLLLVFEGALRKWVVPSASSYVYFAKDLLLLGVYSGFLRERKSRAVSVAIPEVLTLTLGAAATIAMLDIFNPHLPNLLVGILGFKAYFFYVPLLWVVPVAYRDEQAVATFIKRYLVVAIPVALLAVAQFFSPGGSWINTYARTEGPSATAITFGAVENVRVTGTFSFITGYGSYLQVISFLALTLLAVRRWRFRGSLIGYSGLALAVLGMLMTGSRGPVFTLIIFLPIYWLLGVAREGGVPALGRFLLGIGLVASIVNVVGADAVEAFRARAAGSSDVQSRIIQPFLNPIRIAPEVGIAGYGTGATHQMAEVVAPGLYPYSWLEGFQFEDEPSRVMVELGFLGFLAFFAARTGLVFLALRAVFRLKRPLPRALALSCLLLFLAQLTGGVVFNVTEDVYYWYFGGLLFLAERLERDARVKVPPARERWRAERDRGRGVAVAGVAG